MFETEMLILGYAARYAVYIYIRLFNENTNLCGEVCGVYIYIYIIYIYIYIYAKMDRF